MKRRIIVRVFPDGRTTIEAKGFTGRKCFDVTRFIEEGLASPPSAVCRSHRASEVVPDTQKLGGGS